MDRQLNMMSWALLLFSAIYFLIYLFIFIQLQLSAFSPHPSIFTLTIYDNWCDFVETCACVFLYKFSNTILSYQNQVSLKRRCPFQLFASHSSHHLGSAATRNYEELFWASIFAVHLALGYKYIFAIYLALLYIDI